MTGAEYKPPDLTLIGEEHIRRYVETDGVVGHEWNGVHTLVLTTTGRKSGMPRRSAMIYGQSGESFVVIASQGGAPTHPNWFHNLRVNPHVQVQVGAERFEAVARIAEGEERQALWSMMVGQWSNFDIYATRTERIIPVVVLERS
jgi:deazaflavin-dependent oxidoreductase (nitroreductase family)